MTRPTEPGGTRCTYRAGCSLGGVQCADMGAGAGMARLAPADFWHACICVACSIHAWRMHVSACMQVRYTHGVLCVWCMNDAYLSQLLLCQQGTIHICEYVDTHAHTPVCVHAYALVPTHVPTCSSPGEGCRCGLIGCNNPFWGGHN